MDQQPTKPPAMTAAERKRRQRERERADPDYKQRKLDTRYMFGETEIGIILDDKGELWFKGMDVAKALEYEDPNSIICEYVQDKHKKSFQTLIEGSNRLRDIGGMQPNTTFIDECGLYLLVIRSRKPKANEFTEWVCGNVLTSISKTGQYKIDPEKSPLRMMNEFKRQCAELEHERNRNNKLEHELNEKREVEQFNKQLEQTLQHVLKEKQQIEQNLEHERNEKLQVKQDLEHERNEKLQERNEKLQERNEKLQVKQDLEHERNVKQQIEQDLERECTKVLAIEDRLNEVLDNTRQVEATLREERFQKTLIENSKIQIETKFSEALPRIIKPNAHSRKDELLVIIRKGAFQDLDAFDYPYYALRRQQDTVDETVNTLRRQKYPHLIIVKKFETPNAVNLFNAILAKHKRRFKRNHRDTNSFQLLALEGNDPLEQENEMIRLIEEFVNSYDEEFGARNASLREHFEQFTFVPRAQLERRRQTEV